MEKTLSETGLRLRCAEDLGGEGHKTLGRGKLGEGKLGKIGGQQGHREGLSVWVRRLF